MVAVQSRMVVSMDETYPRGGSLSMATREWADPLLRVFLVEWSVPGCKPIWFCMTEELLEELSEDEARQVLREAEHEARVIFFPNDHPVWWWRT